MQRTPKYIAPMRWFFVRQVSGISTAQPSSSSATMRGPMNMNVGIRSERSRSIRFSLSSMRGLLAPFDLACPEPVEGLEASGSTGGAAGVRRAAS